MVESFNDGYVGPAYEMTRAVVSLRGLPRFGYSNDFTALISSEETAQVDYTAGLVALSIFLLNFFLFWSITILVLKIMGPGNAGFLSGHPFVIHPIDDDEKNHFIRPFRVRIAFLVSSVLLMIFAFLFVTLGLANVSNATTTMNRSLQTAEELMNYTLDIASKLGEVGRKSVELRDATVQEMKKDFCPANPNVEESIGIDITSIAEKAKSDLTMLATFISDGLQSVKNALTVTGTTLSNIDDVISYVNFMGWQTKLLAAGLFILPSFLIIGVGLAMLDLDIKPYQRALTYCIMPLFVLTVIATFIFCSLTIPIAAATADACSGGGQVAGGPDDTLQTIYRNLEGDDTGLLFLFVMFYTQRCLPIYYPFEILDNYFRDIDTAIISTDSFIDTIGINLSLLEQQCGREFNTVLKLIKDTNTNLRELEEQASLSLDLFQCKNINDLYVNTVHEAGCTYSVNAFAWILACSIIISICGLTMIMLRSSCYPEQYLSMSSAWNTKQAVNASFNSQSPTSMFESNTPETLDSLSLEIERSRQQSQAPQSATLPSTSPRLLFQFNDNSIECSPDRNPHRSSHPIVPPSRNTRDDNVNWI